MNKKIVLVTGANRGLGLATARALAEQGHRVLLGARTQEKADTAAAQLIADGLDAHGVAIDVSSDAHVAQALDAIHDTHGRVDVLVNNAGAIFERDTPGTLEVTTDQVAEAFNTNTLGAMRTMRALLPRMNAAGFGRIVNVSSGMGGLTDMGSDHTAYRVSKTALNSLTRVYSTVAGPNVKVNAVCPGWVRTDMGGPHATRDLAQGIAGIVWAATLPEDGPSGGFFRDGAPIAW